MPLPPLPNRWPGHKLNGVVAPAADAAWAVGDGFVFRWDGYRWRRSHAPQGVYNAVDATSRRDVWAVGIRPSGGSTVVHWDGKQWRRTPAPSTLGALGFTLNAILALGPRDVWVVGGPRLAGGSPPFAAHWNGTEWASYPIPDPYPSVAVALDSVFKGPGGSIYAAGDGGYVWSNGTWTPIDFGGYFPDPIASRGTTLWGISDAAQPTPASPPAPEWYT